MIIYFEPLSCYPLEEKTNNDMSTYLLDGDFVGVRAVSVASEPNRHFLWNEWLAKQMDIRMSHNTGYSGLSQPGQEDAILTRSCEGAASTHSCNSCHGEVPVYSCPTFLKESGDLDLYGEITRQTKQVRLLWPLTSLSSHKTETSPAPA